MMTFIIANPWLSAFAFFWLIIVIFGWLFVAGAAIATDRCDPSASPPDDPYLLNKDARRSAVEARPVPLAEYIERAPLLSAEDARVAHRAAVDAGYADLAGYVERYGRDA